MSDGRFEHGQDQFRQKEYGPGGTMEGPEFDTAPSITPPAEPGYSAEVDSAQQEKSLRRVLIAGLILLAILVAAFRSQALKAAWDEISTAIGLRPSAGKVSKLELAHLALLSPQQQAERLVRGAIGHQPQALELIRQRVDGWRGAIRYNRSLSDLLQVAMNSDDMRVREAAVEVELAAYNVAKTPQSFARMVREAEPGGSNRRWALWTLGLLGNRGVQPDRAREALLVYVHDPQREARYWAVEGLAHLGQDESVPPLLEVLRNDPAPEVREAAARSLAASGMFNHQQRMKAVPELIDDLGDTSLDGNTRGWVHRALREITGQNLSPDARLWRQWYAGFARTPSRAQI